jgi:hypothetical protein
MAQSAGPKRRKYQAWQTAQFTGLLGDDWFARCLEIIGDPKQAASLSDEQLQALHYGLGYGYLIGVGGECDEELAEKHLNVASSAGWSSPVVSGHDAL